jgi:ABC-type lipoprotein export system ATPase subunit
MEAMRELRDEGVGFVVASHDPLVVERVDHVVHLHHGRIEEEEQ